MESAVPVLYGRLGEDPAKRNWCMSYAISLEFVPYYIQRVVYRVPCTGTGQRRAIRRKSN